MMSKKQNSPPRIGPRIEAELEQLYRRKSKLDDLIRSLEAYMRVGPVQEETRRKVA